MAGRIAAIVFGLCGLLGMSAQAATLRPAPTTDPRILECLQGATGTLRVKAERVASREDASLRWTTTKPASCERLNVEFLVKRPSSGLHPVLGSGSGRLQPLVAETLQLVARIGDFQRVLAVASVSLDLEREIFLIDANDQRQKLVDALQTPHALINVADGVEIDLSNPDPIPIATGVTLQGGRNGLNQGARLFSRVRPGDGMFKIENDRVRISGLRLEGPDPLTGPITADVVSRGILIDSANEVDIHNNEIFGWTTAAIEVQDRNDKIPTSIPYTIRIYDNYIHHNQHEDGNGYGVATRHGGYAWIAQNVFDWNRHAIAAGGQPGSGYTADANLVLENGGLHTWIPFPGIWRYTHQFDAHGSQRCVDELFVEHNCGPAGESFLITDNTFFYTRDNAIKLRGTPSEQPYGMYVSGNMFAHEWVSDAVSETESGLLIGPGNVANNRVVIQEPHCDFDGDGTNDRVMTTGATWWYASGSVMQWRYLNEHTEKAGGDWKMSYVNSDRFCDITARGVVYSGGKVRMSEAPVLEISDSLPPALPAVMLR